MNKKAEIWHWIFLSLALIGIVFAFDYVTGTSTSDFPPVSKETGVDITALVVMGG